jgi:hypothetical protein
MWLQSRSHDFNSASLKFASLSLRKALNDIHKQKIRIFFYYFYSILQQINVDKVGSDCDGF